MSAEQATEMVEEIAEMIADWYGHATTVADRDLAAAIIAKLGGEVEKQYRNPTYGWRTDDLA